jgi:hypothetical protein
VKLVVRPTAMFCHLVAMAEKNVSVASVFETLKIKEAADAK